MRNTKKLHAVPAVAPPLPAVRNAPRPLRHKPTFEGTKATPEVSRALRRVLRDHTPRARTPRDAPGPSHLQMLLWVLLVAGLVLAAVLANRPDAKSDPVRTYQLEMRK
jgi:hypothetical protein